MEEIKQEWESFKKCTCSTFRDKCSNCIPQEEIADWWLKKLDLAVSKERKRITQILLQNVLTIQDHGQFFKPEVMNLINTK